MFKIAFAFKIPNVERRRMITIIIGVYFLIYDKKHKRQYPIASNMTKPEYLR